jgi:hypothetical protein
MVIPFSDQAVLTPPFDIVVKHEGCGTVDASTFQAFLESEKGEQVKVNFQLDTTGQRWILRDYDPKTQFKQGSYGRFYLHVTAAESGLCFSTLPVFPLKVAEFIAPQFFSAVPGKGPAVLNPPYWGSVVFHSALHDSGDIDYFTVKATDSVPNGAFGSWFNIKVSSVKNVIPCPVPSAALCDTPNNYVLAFRLLSPKNNDNLIERKNYSSTLWVGLKNGVSTQFKVTSADVFPNNENLEPYKVEITQISIPDQNEPNDYGTSATAELKKGVLSFNYMAAVLDAEGKTVGLVDFFKIKHRDCVVDCLDLENKLDFENKKDSRPYLVTFCKENSEYPDLCGEGGAEVKVDDKVDNRYCAYQTGVVHPTGDRYWRVAVDCTKADCAFGDAEDDSSPHYGYTYNAKWSEKCIYPSTVDNCLTHEEECAVINPLKP